MSWIENIIQSILSGETGGNWVSKQIANLLNDLIRPLLTEMWVSSLELIVKEFNKILAMDLNVLDIGFYDSAMANIDTISRTIFIPLGTCILCLFIAFEFIQIISRHESINGNAGLELPLKVMFKATLCIILYSRLTEILNEMIVFFNDIIQKIGALAITINNSIDFSSINAETLVTEYTIGDMILLILVTYIVVGIVIVAGWLIKIMFIGRGFELIILTVLAPLPLSTIPSQEHHMDAWRFMKSFAAVLLQGGVLYLIMFLWGSCVNLFVVNTNGDAYDLLGKFAIYSFVLIIAAMNSGRYTEKALSSM